MTPHVTLVPARHVKVRCVANRAILVTGASRGIGRAIAQAFAAAGDRVAIHHRDSAALAGEVLAGLPGAGHAVVQAGLVGLVPIASAMLCCPDRLPAGCTQWAGH